MLLRLVAILSLTACVSTLSESADTAAAAQAASVDNGGLSTEGVATLDGMSIDAIPEGRSAEAVISTSIPKDNWTASADSFQPDHPPSYILDDNLDTFWHTTYTPGVPPSARTGVSNFMIFLIRMDLSLSCRGPFSPELILTLIWGTRR